jgi:hypothetical protein
VNPVPVTFMHQESVKRGGSDSQVLGSSNLTAEQTASKVLEFFSEGRLLLARETRESVRGSAIRDLVPHQ